jgi:hypothetical protein
MLREISPGVFEGGAPAPVPPAVLTVTRRQALRGLLDDIEAAINELPEPQRSAARIDWESAAEFRRDFPLLVGLAAAIGLTESQVDDLFAAAAAIT